MEKEHLEAVTEIVAAETVEVVDGTLVVVTAVVDGTLVVAAVIVAGNEKAHFFFDIFGISFTNA